MAHQCDDRLLSISLQGGGCDFGGRGGLLTVTEPVDHRHQHAVGKRLYHVLITRNRLGLEGRRGNAPFERRRRQLFHFFMTTVVPRPISEMISNSSIRRRAPGRPIPRPPEVEYPSCSACATSGMPGPSSRAIMTTPCRTPESTGLMTISPARAYSTIFRATSEMAVAIRVNSLPKKPNCSASARPCCRAVKISASDRIETRRSPRRSPAAIATAFDFQIQIDQALFKIERGGDAFQGQPQLHHRKRHIRRNSHDNRFGPAQPDDVCDRAQGADRERVDHVQGGHVHDNAARTKTAHP